MSSTSPRDGRYQSQYLVTQRTDKLSNRRSIGFTIGKDRSLCAQGTDSRGDLQAVREDCEGAQMIAELQHAVGEVRQR